MAASYFFRAFAELFPAATPVSLRPQPAACPASARPAASSPAAPRHVGTGEANETFVTIDGVPNLFVDEGDCVVQFSPAFEEAPRDTRFGTKILPDLAPHWSVQCQHEVPLRDAIASAIRAKAIPHVAVVADAALAQPRKQAHDEPRPRQPGSDRQQRRESPSRPTAAHGRGDQAATIGRVLSWGEEDFPNRKPHGKPFYTSFAMHVETALGEQVLQGEGLKDAIAESACQVGDRVSVRRLRKVKVAAFHESGRPVLKNGEQVYWDKWLWSITHS